MKQLLIIGARGWGREVYAMLPNSIGYGVDFEMKGFLDDDKDVLKGFKGYPPIIESVENYVPQTDDVFVCALGDPRWKQHYTELILNKGGVFINIIHKQAKVGINTSLGYGCVLSKDVSISCDIKIGNFVTFQRLSTIGHDASIGDFCNLGAMTFMGGGASLGEASIIYTNAIILPHIKIGKKCVVGAGSVVLRSVKDNTTVFGNPAKKMDI